MIRILTTIIIARMQLITMMILIINITIILIIGLAPERRGGVSEAPKGERDRARSARVGNNDTYMYCVLLLL